MHRAADPARDHQQEPPKLSAAQHPRTLAVAEAPSGVPRSRLRPATQRQALRARHGGLGTICRPQSLDRGSERLRRRKLIREIGTRLRRSTEIAQPRPKLTAQPKPVVNERSGAAHCSRARAQSDPSRSPRSVQQETRSLRPQNDQAAAHGEVPSARQPPPVPAEQAPYCCRRHA